MHEYTVIGHDRKKIYYSLALLSGGLSPVLAGWISQASNLTSIPLIAPSGLAIFGLLFLLFDHVLWKWSLFYRIGIIKIPNLGGQWNGQLISSKQPQQQISTVVTIHQTYSNIRVRLETQYARSLSLMAAFEMVDPACFNLSYEYLSEYRSQKGDIIRHYGVARIALNTDNDNVDKEQRGYYYTEKNRDAFGEIILERRVKRN
jgi:SMODS-associating 2TM, beta-strand rich effector domain